jgi:putative Mg2+ transporter-C (MgtC) family protein
MDSLLKLAQEHQALVQMTTHLVVAMIAGGIIGMERSYHGRPAGFRTHILVCMSSALLMVVTVYQNQWFSEANSAVKVATDPTRMAQGIMTGIGFLGAGVIMKDGLSVRGLTTAASIWITSAIGILAGIGLYSLAAIGTFLTFATLAFFGWLEGAMPARFFGKVDLVYPQALAPTEKDLRKLLKQHGFTLTSLSYVQDRANAIIEYHITVRAERQSKAKELSAIWRDDDKLIRIGYTPG